MVNITLAIPDELKSKLKQHKEVNWSAVMRRAFQEHLRKMEIAEAIANKSKLTKEDVIKIDKLVKSSMAYELGLK